MRKRRLWALAKGNGKGYPAVMPENRPQKSGNTAPASFFRKRRSAEDAAAPGYLSDHLTFRNIVFALGVAAFLIFLGSAVSARIALLFAALLGLAGLFALDMSARRRWESDMDDQMQRLNLDYERMIREVARNRNDIAALKKALAAAGDAAKSQKPGEGEGVSIEQRLIRTIADQLSALDKKTVEEQEAAADIETLLPEGISPDYLTDEQTLELLHAAVRQNRVDLFLQPIVNLPQRKVRYYEMFSRIRIRPDVYLPAEKYIAVAMRHDLLSVIDNLLLLRGLQHIRDTSESDPNRSFFCNITSLTLNDPKFMGDLVEFIAQNRTLAPRLVFEMGQRDLATMSADILPVLQGLAQLGCRFSMDQVRSISFDIVQLEIRHIRFIKVDAGLMLTEIGQIGGFSRIRRLKAELDRQGIDLIIEKIETEGQIRELLDLEIDYGQGYLFGRPAQAEH